MDLWALTLSVEPPGAEPGTPSGSLSGWSGAHAQAWFLAWLRGAAPELSSQLHDSDQRKPYTVSPLLKDDTLRITSLSAPLSAQLDALIAAAPPQSVQLGDVPLAIRTLTVAHTTYADVVRAATDYETPLDLRFVTPTAFRSHGLDVPLPLPPLVFGSLIQSWNAFSPLPLPLHLRALIQNNVAVTRCTLQTRRVSAAGRGVRVGFTGRATFNVRTKDDPGAARRLLGALVRYADWAGVGVQTAAGMGQVRNVGSGAA